MPNGAIQRLCWAHLPSKTGPACLMLIDFEHDETNLYITFVTFIIQK